MVNAKTSRASATAPVTAAAATMTGLMSSVRPVGLPWRPLKSRVDLVLDTLIAVKRAAGRPKDAEAVAELELLRDELRAS